MSRVLTEVWVGGGGGDEGGARMGGGAYLDSVCGDGRTAGAAALIQSNVHRHTSSRTL